jgi:hypothetical protein
MDAVRAVIGFAPDIWDCTRGGVQASRGLARFFPAARRNLPDDLRIAIGGPRSLPLEACGRNVSDYRGRQCEPRQVLHSP